MMHNKIHTNERAISENVTLVLIFEQQNALTEKCKLILKPYRYHVDIHF